MKRIIALALVLLALCGCTASPAEPSYNFMPTELPSGEPSVEPTYQFMPTEMPSVEPSDEPPYVDMPLDMSTAEPDIDLNAFCEKLFESYTFGTTITYEDGETRSERLRLDYANESDRETLDGYYDGICALEPRALIAHVSTWSMVEFELVVLRVADESDIERAAEILQSRIDYMVGDGNGPGGAWYPEPTEVWQNNSRIVAHGSYLMFVVHPLVDEIVPLFDALFE